jgi:hypothetical protein
VRHRNLVELKELLFEDGHWLIVMELVRGVPIVDYARGASVSTEPSLGPAAVLSPRDETLRRTSEANALPRTEPRRPGVFRVERVRQSFFELTQGLVALHSAHKLHRDLKPSNVLVDAGGRVTILDFGLATDLGATGTVERAELVGTPRYMSPEQARSAPVGPASDWYSVGAMLFEALTGELPAESNDTPPSALCPDVPPDLSELCRELLRVEPAARPHGQSLARRWAWEQHLALGAPAAERRREETFVGREAELAELERAHRRSAEFSPVIVVVEGESGVGKTALVERFTSRLAAATLVFRGRCFERESLPYKAFDGVVEGIAAHLSGLPHADARVLLGGYGAAIARAFPAFETLLLKLEEALPGGDAFEVHRERQRAFAGLKRVLSRLASRTPTVIVIDDMQWSDVDSLTLLSTLMRPPGTPRVLLTLLQRPHSPLSEIELPGEVIELTLGPLSSADSDALLSELLGERPGRLQPAERARLTREAGGHPLFLRELVRHAGTPAAPGSPGFALDDILGSRVSALASGARLLVELACVAGAPIVHASLAEAFTRASALLEASAATAQPPSHVAACLAELTHASLLRTTGPRPADRVEPFHDRVREAVLAHLPTARRRELHQALALTLETTPLPDSEALSVHFEGMGAPRRAYEYSLAAAEEAERSLAFERAARLYRRAIELGAGEAAALGRLKERLGTALANAGRGGEAAEAYAEAADANRPERLRLQELAAEQWLRSGYIERGVEAFFAVLGELGVRVPRYRWLALLSLLVLRVRIELGGFRARPRNDPLTPEEEVRIDGTWSAAICLTMFDNVRSAELQCQNTLLALDGGSPLQVLRAHTAEAMFLALGGRGNRRRIQRLLASASALGKQIGDAEASAWVAISRGASAFFLGEWAESESQCTHAESVLQHRAGARFELGSARAFRVWSAMMQGSFREVLALVPLYVEEAEDRGDLYSATYQMTGFSNVAWLTRDDVNEARKRLALVEERWPPERFDVPRYMNLMAAAHIELYAGDGVAAYRRVLRDWASLRWGVAFRAQITRFGMRFARGLSALAAYDATGKRSLLADAASCAKAIRAEGVVWSRCFAEILASGVAAREQRLEACVSHLERAEADATVTGMRLHRVVVRYRRGELIGGDTGRALTDDAVAFMQGEAIQRPERMLAMLSPRVKREA